MLYLGLDVHSNWTCVSGFDPVSGETIEIRRMDNDEQSIKEALGSLSGPVYGAMETGTNAWAMYRLLAPYFAELTIVDPASLWDRRSDRVAKTDKLDARRLAEKLYRGELRGLYVPDDYVRDIRCLARFKVRASRLVTKLTNEIASLARSWGYVDQHSVRSQAGRRTLEELDLGPYSLKVLSLWREMLARAEEIERELETAIKQACASDEQCGLLMSIPGVGSFTALLVRAEVGDVRRFERAGHLLSYCGLVPRVYQSSESIRYGHLVPWGDRWLKYALSLFAQRVGRSRQDSCYKRTYWRIHLRGHPNSAKMAVARQVARHIWAIMHNKTRWRDPVLRACAPAGS